MPTINHLILTAGEAATALSLNVPGAIVAINPRAVSSPTAGVGLNLNDQAINYAPGEPVPLAGAFVASKKIIDDPTHIEQTPDLVDFLKGMPFALLDTEAIYLPEVE